MRRTALHSGFTLIELMMVVAIVGLLSAIAIPKFANMILKAKQAALKGRLGSIRSAITIYYADNEGIFPQQNSTSASPYTIPTPMGQWLDALHPRYLGTTDLWVENTVLPHTDATAKFLQRTAIWVLTNDWYGENVYMYRIDTGHFWINCTHPDVGGRIWSQQ